MAQQPPRLPVELILEIFRHYAVSLEQPTPIAWRSNPSPSFERTLKALTLIPNLAGPAREVLFHTVHVGSDKRGAALLQALRASFLHPAQVDDEGKRQPAWREEGHLKQLVKSLRIDVMEREVDLGKKQGASGVFPSDIEALAAALPDITTLDISCSDKGSNLDSAMIRSLRQFSKVKSMEIEATGYHNAFSVFSELRGLEDLKLRALSHGFANHIKLYASNRDFLALPRAPEPILFGQCLRTLVLQRIVLDPATTLTQLFTSSGLNPAVLENLVIIKLVAPPAANGAASFAIPPDALQAVLQPFVVNLRHFHLDLFDVPPITNSEVRTEFKLLGLFTGGVLVVPDSGHRPATFLAPSFGPRLEQLVLGGPMNVQGADFFDQLSDSPARITELTLSQCAANPNKPYVDGITPEDLILSLDTEWATALERIDVRGMQSDFEDSKGKDVPAWNWEAIERIEAKLRELEGGSSRKIELLHSTSKPVQRRTSASTKGTSSKATTTGKRARDQEKEPKPRKSSKK